MRKTKIICTLGPAVDNVDMIKKLLHSGVTRALQFFTRAHEEHRGASGQV
jgi:pyruvate kinase